MTRIAPDIPELEHVPDAVRSLVYMRALANAIRSPLTWLIGVVVLAMGVGIGDRLGETVLDGLGSILGIVIGASAAIWCFFALILPWRAQRLVPAAIRQADHTLLDNVRDADEAVKRMVDEYKRREGSNTGTPKP